MELIRARGQAFQDSSHGFIKDLGRADSLVRKAPPRVKRTVYGELVEALGINASEHLMLHSRRAGASLEPFSSFTTCMHLRARKKQMRSRVTYESKLISKDNGYRFAEAIGARIPKNSADVFMIDSFPFRAGVVAKPRNGQGARGVFIIHAEDHIIEVSRAAAVTGGFGRLRARIRAVLGEGHFNMPDAWISEDIIYEDPENFVPARDLKFYSFFGNTPLIGEIVRFPVTQSCWWERDGSKVQAGKLYKDQGELEGIGVTVEAMAFVQNISRQIPAPFMRIDILNGHDGPVLGEFTGHPGNYQQFVPKYDRMLGEAFLDAEDRLTAALIDGEKFEPFFACFDKDAAKKEY